MRALSKIALLATAAGAALLASACNNNQATTTTANTTEVAPTDTETSSTSDAMVTNIDAAGPAAGGTEDNGSMAEPTGNAM
jgi:hypothetical protein